MPLKMNYQRNKLKKLAQQNLVGPHPSQVKDIFIMTKEIRMKNSILSSQMLSKQKTSALVAAVQIVIRFIGLSILFVKSQKD